jgi:UDP-N-acetylglucosamine 2-epimerase (non-hydrolysing)
VKVVTVVGTRPEIIRLSRVIVALDEAVDHKVIHTGQNYDHELNQVFFDDLGLRAPDHNLGVDTSSLGRVLGGVLSGIEPLLAEEAPDALLVLGDTNSCIAAVMAKRMGIPVFHMEAGNRCFDENVPEETNRRIIDHVADFNLAYTEHARRNLLAEGLPPRRIYVTGSPLREVLDHYRPQIDASTVLEDLGLQEGGYFLVSVHREENVDNRAALEQLVAVLCGLHDAHGLPVIVSTHPRTRRRLTELDPELGGRDIRFLKPFGFHAYNKLQLRSFCVVSDSGSIAEESSMLGFPAVSPRVSIERPEALDTGSIVAPGRDPAAVLAAVELVVRESAAGHRPPTPSDYTVTNTSQRVVRLIVGLAGISNQWSARVVQKDLRPEDGARA